MADEIVAPLSEDERAVLMIAALGNSMIPIGRWEDPIKSLAKRGYMKKLDEVNYVITEAGRKASEAAEDAAVGDYIDAARRAF